VAGPDGAGLLVSGRALRAESRLYLAERKARTRAVAARAPAGAGEARHRHRLAQARHEAARTVVDWALEQGVGTLVVGHPAGVLAHDSGARHNQRVRDWRPGQLGAVLTDKAEALGIAVVIVDERSTSSTCPACERVFIPETITHRRGGRHLPGARASLGESLDRHHGGRGSIDPSPETGPTVTGAALRSLPTSHTRSSPSPRRPSTFVRGAPRSSRCNTNR